VYGRSTCDGDAPHLCVCDACFRTLYAPGGRQMEGFQLSSGRGMALPRERDPNL